MPNNLTITGKVGPGTTVTSLIFTNVDEINFHLTDKVLEVKYFTDGSNNLEIQHFDLAVEATVTYTISAGVATIVIST